MVEANRYLVFIDQHRFVLEVTFLHSLGISSRKYRTLRHSVVSTFEASHLNLIQINLVIVYHLFEINQLEHTETLHLMK